MKQNVTTYQWFILSCFGLLVSFLLLSFALYGATSNSRVFGFTIPFFIASVLWQLFLLFGIRRVITTFTGAFCKLLDEMIDPAFSPEAVPAAETLFSRLQNRLLRHYDILSKGRNSIQKERLELQSLISDIAHQVKTPVSNLRMLTDTLLNHPVTEEEKQEFLNGIGTQTDKLDFLFDAMLKTSRLETGLIQLQPKNGRLYDTLAQSLAGIMQSAARKSISVEVDCPETLTLPHDSRWTAEAFFNLLDNAVKYTDPGGVIRVTVQVWELYVNLSVQDNGRGIPECNQASIFKRFYREAESMAIPGVGIGLYLTREIITKQGGYIKVSSSPGKGSVFSVFLPKSSS